MTWRTGSGEKVRAVIARTVLGEQKAELELGTVKLHPHQASAVQRLDAAIEQFNGALLCDEVGMGKTYVALAVARKYRACLIVMPATLVSMWRSALAATRVDAGLISLESLSRADVEDRRKRDSERYDLVIVDEAHHVRNPRTNRYFALESLVRGARVLLLSATPLHNRRGDLVALLSLFLGSRAQAMTSAELALCVVRREQKQLARTTRIPRVLPLVYHTTHDDPELVHQLVNLPPPVPPRDGGLAGALIGRGLVHQWSSSEAALHEAVNRRIARATALCASLEAGTYPTSRELETWVYGEGALQLGFAELLSAPFHPPTHRELLDAMTAHLTALKTLKTGFDHKARLDSERARVVARIREQNTSGKIVAFAQYAETVSMLFRRLFHSGGLAMLTAHGARVAGGPLTRNEAIARFSPEASGVDRPSRAEVIDVLLTTDLLSEGVNLQDAQTVVHIDVPWTAARMEQRVGRVARIGSRHDRVAVHVIRPPASAAALVAAEAIVERKWAVANRVVGSTQRPLASANAVPGPGESAATESPASRAEALRAILGDWLARGPAHDETVAGEERVTLVATLVSDEPGFIAAVSQSGSVQLIVGGGNRVSADLFTQIASCRIAIGAEDETDAADVDAASRLIHDWCSKEAAAETAGLGASGALRRRDLINRIDALIDGAPPHLRAARLALAARARVAATQPQCAAVERELGLLVESDLKPDAWLAAVADLDSRQAGPQQKDGAQGEFKIHALLILRVKPRRSRPLPDPESP